MNDGPGGIAIVEVGPATRDAHEPHKPECKPALFRRDEQRHVPEKRGRLHERAGVRNEKADPKKPKVAVAKSGERSRVAKGSRNHGDV
jgi:hypothetical protein